jgi:hypothetical protein
MKEMRIKRFNENSELNISDVINCKISISDISDCQENGIVTIWRWNEKTYNQQYISDIEIWKILTTKQIYDMCVLQETIEIDVETLDKNFTNID